MLVFDYVFDDRYDEDCEDEDARTITTFIAVGCSQSADRVVDALLPNALRCGTAETRRCRRPPDL